MTWLLSRAIMTLAFMKSANMEKFRGIFSLVTDTNQNRLEYNSVHLSVKYELGIKLLFMNKVIWNIAKLSVRFSIHWNDHL